VLILTEKKAREMEGMDDDVDDDDDDDEGEEKGTIEDYSSC